VAEGEKVLVDQGCLLRFVSIAVWVRMGQTERG
jgi:hypothetical protein